MTLRQKTHLLFWGTIARIGHLLQTREVRQLERQLHQQAMMLHNLYAQLIETEERLRAALAARQHEADIAAIVDDLKKAA
jgi:Tfp pilus assembly protein PilO